MNRRDFLKAGFASAAMVGAGLGTGLYGRPAMASVPVPRTLVNVMLLGGSDLRYAIVPHPSHDPVYIEQFWTAREPLYTENYADYAAMYASEYQTVQDTRTGFEFGIHNSCGWLAQQFTDGNVAIIANVFGSLNRRHDHSQLIVNTGDVLADRLIYSRDGWGGRLVETLGGASNVVSISSDVSIFCQGSNQANRLARVIHAQNTRDIALPNVNPEKSVTHRSNILTRALKGYYEQRGSEVAESKAASWPYHRFFQHNSAFRSFGDAVDQRLATQDLPAPLSNLDLNNNSFEQQCRNIYDCCLVPDILGLSTLSMDYGGWDTHKDQQVRINRNLQDIFGSNGGLDVLYEALAQNIPAASDSLLFNFASDFGRQLAVNGSRGTDHGRGSYSIVIGHAVNGGVFGDMFPLREALPDPADSLGRTPFQITGRDIDGLTAVGRINSALCDWLQPGSGAQVFPDAPSSAVENGLDLSQLLSV